MTMPLRPGAALLDPLVALKYEAERDAGRVTFPTRRYASDAPLFCTEILGYSPTGRQIEIFQSVIANDRTAIPSGRKTGKSRLLASLALWWFCQWDDATCVIVCPSEAQIREVTYYDLTGLFHTSGRCVACTVRDPLGPRPCPHSCQIDGTLSPSVRAGLRSGQRRVIGIAPRNADNARGISGPHQLWLFDESSGIRRAVYDAADGNRAAGAKIVAAGQPTSRASWFFDACATFNTIRLSSVDSPNVKLGIKIVAGLADVSWIEEKKSDWGEDDWRYQIEVLGLFPSREADRIVSDEELADCAGRHETEPVPDAPLWVGIDPAGGTGNDQSSIVVRRGGRVLEMVAFNGATDRILGELDILLRRHRKWKTEPVTVNFDGSSNFGVELHRGIGNVRLHGDMAITANALEMKGDPHRDPVLRESRCARLIDAYYMNLSIRLRSDAAIPFDDVLRSELLFWEWKKDHEGGNKLISKREHRKALGKSPDLSDALAFAFWEGRVQPASVAAAEYEKELARPPLPGPPVDPRDNVYTVVGDASYLAARSPSPYGRR